MRKHRDVKDLCVPCSGKLIYLLFMAYCSRKGEISVSIKEISARLGISPSTVNRNIKRLRKDGLLYVQPNYDKNGMRAVNRYYLKDIYESKREGR